MNYIPITLIILTIATITGIYKCNILDFILELLGIKTNVMIHCWYIQFYYISIYKPLETVGKYSMLIWFIHGIFNNQLKIYTQPIIYATKNKVLITITALIICLVIAYFYSKIIDSIKKKIKKCR